MKRLINGPCHVRRLKKEIAMSLSSLQRSRSRLISRACFETLEDRRMLSFSPATSFPVGTNPQAVVTADFNNDGKLDLATSNYDGATGDGSVSVLLGNGDGSFQPTLTSATGPYTYSLAAGDFNADGKIDLATANWGAGDNNDVSILLGNGDGTFADAVALNISDAYSLSVATGDLNADGKLDLVVTSDTEDGGYYLSTLLGHGDGSFASPTTYNSYYGQLFSQTLADFNGDGNVDVAAAGWQMYGALVYLGNGDGTLQEPLFFDSDTGTGANSVTAADFNADGNIDLVTTNYFSNSASVLLGNGDGSFAPAQGITAGSGPGSATASDVNGDGKLDLVVTRQASPGAVSVLLGKGDGSLAVPITIATGGSPSSLVMADFNGDGRPDAAAANIGSNNVSVLLNDGNWAVQTTPPRITISDVTKAEGKNGSSTSVTFTVSLSAAYDQPVTVSYRTVNGTATAGSDYTSTSGSVTFAPGETTKTITIQVKGDNKRESNETFYLELFNNSSNSLLTRTRGIGTILNDDN
jgi:trimeric autotransporter adhesin